jgi:hypothetical protein
VASASGIAISANNFSSALGFRYYAWDLRNWSRRGRKFSDVSTVLSIKSATAFGVVAEPDSRHSSRAPPRSCWRDSGGRNRRRPINLTSRVWTIYYRVFTPMVHRERRS